METGSPSTGLKLREFVLDSNAWFCPMVFEFPKIDMGWCSCWDCEVKLKQIIMNQVIVQMMAPAAGNWIWFT